MYILKKGNKAVLSGGEKLTFGNALDGVLPDDLATVRQAATESGTNAFSGVNTFTGATGVTTDTLTPATSGAGTSHLRPAGIFTTATVAAASLKSGGVYGLSKADGQTITLPAAATATIGYNLRFHIVTTCTSVGYVFSKGEAGDVMVGGLYATIAAGSGAAADSEFNIADGTENTLTLGATTACGLAGGYVDFTCISATQWAVSGTVLGSGAIASNLFTTV